MWNPKNCHFLSLFWLCKMLFMFNKIFTILILFFENYDFGFSSRFPLKPKTGNYPKSALRFLNYPALSPLIGLIIWNPTWEFHSPQILIQTMNQSMVISLPHRFQFSPLHTSYLSYLEDKKICGFHLKSMNLILFV